MSEPKITTIRMPFDLSDWLEKQAEQQHRSVNGQILHVLAKEKRAQESNENGEAWA